MTIYEKIEIVKTLNIGSVIETGLKHLERLEILGSQERFFFFFSDNSWKRSSQNLTYCDLDEIINELPRKVRRKILFNLDLFLENNDSV